MESTPCVMCDKPIHYNYQHDEWQHDNGDYYCPGKGSCVATHPDPEQQQEQESA